MSPGKGIFANTGFWTVYVASEVLMKCHGSSWRPFPIPFHRGHCGHCLDDRTGREGGGELLSPWNAN